MRPITLPDLLEQIRYFLLWRSDIQKFPAQEKPHSSLAPPSSEAGWRYVGNEHIPIWFHSKWVANYARYLEGLRSSGHFKEWRYQSKTFSIKGIRGGYTPDFWMLKNDESHFWVETKSIHEDLDLYEKTVYFEMNYPDESLVFADADWINENVDKLKRYIHDWED